MTRAASMPESLPLPATATAEPSVRNAFGAAMIWTASIRAVILCMGVVAVIASHGQATPNSSGYPWIAFDSEWYVYLLQHGYPATRAHEFFYVIAFFPLLPMLAKPLMLEFSPQLSLVIIANVCAMFGFGFLYHWLRDLTKSARVAFVGTVLMATYPGSVFFSGGLTEGPFFMLVGMTLVLLQRGRLYMAAVVCGIATLARPTGVALAATVACYALVHLAQLPIFTRLAKSALIGLIAASGGLGYGAFLWHRFQTPDAYFQAQEYWERGEQSSLAEQAAAGAPERYSLDFFRQKAVTPQAWNRVIALVLLGVIIAGFIRPGPIPRVLFLLPLIIFLMTALPNQGLRASSIFRYETAGIPLFALAAVWLADKSRRPLLYGIVALGFGIQLYYAFLFSRGVWVG